jgi:hypothetical protein
MFFAMATHMFLSFFRVSCKCFSHMLQMFQLFLDVCSKFFIWMLQKQIWCCTCYSGTHLPQLPALAARALEPMWVLCAGTVDRRNRASVMVRWYAIWGPHGGAHENRRR